MKTPQKITKFGFTLVAAITAGSLYAQSAPQPDTKKASDMNSLIYPVPAKENGPKVSWNSDLERFIIENESRTGHFSLSADDLRKPDLASRVKKKGASDRLSFEVLLVQQSLRYQDFIASDCPTCIAPKTSRDYVLYKSVGGEMEFKEYEENASAAWNKLGYPKTAEVIAGSTGHYMLSTEPLVTEPGNFNSIFQAVRDEYKAKADLHKRVEGGVDPDAFGTFIDRIAKALDLQVAEFKIKAATKKKAQEILDPKDVFSMIEELERNGQVMSIVVKKMDGTEQTFNRVHTTDGVEGYLIQKEGVVEDFLNLRK